MSKLCKQDKKEWGIPAEGTVSVSGRKAWKRIVYSDKCKPEVNRIGEGKIELLLNLCGQLNPADRGPRGGSVSGVGLPELESWLHCMPDVCDLVESLCLSFSHLLKGD